MDLSFTSIQFNYLRPKNLVVFKTKGDGNCFFHALLMALINDYRTTSMDDYIQQLRTELADNLHQITDGQTNYSRLHNNYITEYSKDYPLLSLENLDRTLRTNYSYIGFGHLQHISNSIRKNIYILTSKGPYITQDEHLRINSRNTDSIILHFINNNHYELIGQQLSNSSVRVVFSNDDPLITEISRKFYTS